MSLRDQLQKVYDEHGMLTPKLVVDLARDPDHELHSRFEWDDSVAAEKYRQEQARDLIRKVRVVYREGDEKNPPQTIRAYHSVPDGDGYAYRSTDEVVHDPLLTKMLLAQMERDWKDLHRRWAHMGEFIEMVRKDVAA
jgi:hypothetical protein